MGRGSILSLALLVLPVGVSLGILLGLDAYRSSSGQPRLFLNNKVKNQTYCQTAFGISPYTEGTQYTLNPNQWGLDPGQDSQLCMTVEEFSNGSYPTKSSAPSWSISWIYPPKAATAPVHGFPNIKYSEEGTFPVRVSDVSAVNIDTEWMYFVGNSTNPPAVLDTSLFSSSQTSINTNVAIDMFLDANPNNAQDTTKAKYEIMIWLATFGASTQPIGLQQGPRDSVVLADGTTFNMYYGTNDVTGQVVMTWSAGTPITNFNADISPILKRDVSALGGPSPSHYLGYAAMGSEVLDATVNVTLSVPTFMMNITKS